MTGEITSKLVNKVSFFVTLIGAGFGFLWFLDRSRPWDSLLLGVVSALGVGLITYGFTMLAFPFFLAVTGVKVEDR